ncbi:MAG: hypothetical protein KF901_10165 [Myxococcales bacterium]|nr:hypothetical protein [Myxococcales bacterium]
MRAWTSTLFVLLLGAASPAMAQRTFSAVAERASEVPGDWRRFIAPLFQACEGANRRTCEATRRRDQRTLRTGSWLMSIPAAEHVEIGPYEAVREGFLVRVPDLVLRTPDGWLTTATPRDGVLPVGVLAERFFVVPPDRAERFFGRNDPARLRLRMVFRVGREWAVGSRRGVTIEVSAVQVYNESTGNVLVDSLADPPAPPGGAERLDGRIQVWDRSQLREARWRAPDGTPVLFSVRVDPAEGDAQTPVLLETRGVVSREVGRFRAPCCEATLALIPRGDDVMVVFTERRPSAEHPGRGRVELFQWRNGAFVRRTAWEGSNAESPPAWITDPDAPLP